MLTVDSEQSYYNCLYTKTGFCGGVPTAPLTLGEPAATLRESLRGCKPKGQFA